jgi:predicted metal-dependent peptidase
MIEEAKKAISKAKIALMTKKDAVFFTVICFSLKHEIDETIPTACTNGKYIKYNPQFVLSLTQEELVFLMLHETLHVAYAHMSRLSNRDVHKFNIAADYVINLQLVERGYSMPKDGLLDKQYANMSAEQVYNLLSSNSIKNLPMEDLVSNNSPELAEEINDILIRASIQAKQAGDSIGSIPGELQRFLETLVKPKLPWQRILQKYLTTTIKEDYSYRKPNKRYLPQYYLPTLRSKGMPAITIGIDSSGSVSDADFRQFISEVAKILTTLKPKEINLVLFDTKIISVNKVKTVSELLKVTFTGKGGTRILPMIEWVNNNKTTVAIVITDGHFIHPMEHSKIPWIWAIYDNQGFKPKFGKVINFKL